MNKLWLISLALGCTFSLAATPLHAAAASCNPQRIESANSFQALQWYRSSAEQKALYRQVFATGVATILKNVESTPLKNKRWGVIFSLDGTLLDNSQKALNILKNCTEPTQEELTIWARAELPATPGAATATCQIQKKGGEVIIVSNRDGSEQSPYDLLVATTTNLKQEGICYTSLVFANNSQDSNKNPRFVAIENADYESVVTTKKLPALKIIGYFGNDIEDFPNFKQNTASKFTPDSEYFNQFGKSYFMLPNPAQGSWQNNSLN